MILETVPDDWRFDTLIVDEGQDFDPDWLDILRLFLREGANILWFEDEDQDIRHLDGRGLKLDRQLRDLGFIGYRTRATTAHPNPSPHTSGTCYPTSPSRL
ncbi:MAG: hypothetical protein ABII76_13650 [Pseudomonadota bacterium]